ncbi:hypothetical protein [Alicyclobacillus mengziensis]|uniref:Uncharacterized protein n=1 Tax=Alicyclobacillus mengziensis TaxID=2931921 RepID=A0A9X7VXQ8_9BACL|nr:hypothetical protein [Alicyclobacillus mengziensis]QSO46735.1 hypothetical protein JZ786_20195 [Alicyclobacillus mengziensis]
MDLKQLVLDGNFSAGVRMLAELNDAEVRDTLLDLTRGVFSRTVSCAFAYLRKKQPIRIS